MVHYLYTMLVCSLYYNALLATIHEVCDYHWCHCERLNGGKIEIHCSGEYFINEKTKYVHSSGDIIQLVNI